MIFSIPFAFLILPFWNSFYIDIGSFKLFSFFLFFDVFSVLLRFLLISRFLHLLFQSFYCVFHSDWYNLNFKFVFQCSFWASLCCWLDFIDSGLHCPVIWLVVFLQNPPCQYFCFFSCGWARFPRKSLPDSCLEECPVPPAFCKRVPPILESSAVGEMYIGLLSSFL